MADNNYKPVKCPVCKTELIHKINININKDAAQVLIEAIEYNSDFRIVSYELKKHLLSYMTRYMLGDKCKKDMSIKEYENQNIDVRLNNMHDNYHNGIEFIKLDGYSLVFIFNIQVSDSPEGDRWVMGQFNYDYRDGNIKIIGDVQCEIR